jgi:hypothetical protein
MKGRRFVITMFVSLAGLITLYDVAGQKKTTSPDLFKLAESKRLKHFNRTVSTLRDGTKKGVRLDENQGEGPAYLEGFELADGTIVIVP